MCVCGIPAIQGLGRLGWREGVSSVLLEHCLVSLALRSSRRACLHASVCLCMLAFTALCERSLAVPVCSLECKGYKFVVIRVCGR